MGKILYGVQGDGFGHINRARTISQDMSQHEFLFVGGGTVRQLKAEGYSVVEVPVLDTFYRNNKVDIHRTSKHALKVLANRRSEIKRVAEIINEVDPNLIITDYEYFTAMAARSLGRFCVSLDHQHILTHCVDIRSDQQGMNKIITKAIIKLLFSKPDHFLIVSFFHLPAADPQKTEVFPAIVNRAITRYPSTQGNHILVYQTSSTFQMLLPFLEKINHPIIIYGFGSLPSRRNLFFKGPSKEGFLEDLASCRYVITNGGHNVISEALYLNKPVFSFPIANHYEQFINAYFLAKLGYGSYATDPNACIHVFDAFKNHLNEFSVRIKENFFPGNERLIRRLKMLMGQIH